MDQNHINNEVDDIKNTKKDVKKNDYLDDKSFKGDEIINKLKEINEKLDSFNLDSDSELDSNYKNDDLKMPNQKNTIIAFIILIIVGGILFVLKGRQNVNIK